MQASTHINPQKESLLLFAPECVVIYSRSIHTVSPTSVYAIVLGLGTCDSVLLFPKMQPMHDRGCIYFA